MRRPGLVILVALAAFGCTAVKTLPVSIGDVCSRCRRVITDTSLAGELVNARHYATKYRTPACMAQYLVEHPQESVIGVFVTDYSTGRLIDAEDAYFVATEIDAFKHEMDFAAFARHADATAFGAPSKTTPVGWDAVREFAKARGAN